MNDDMFLPPHIQSKAAQTRVFMEQFHTAEKKKILSEAELLETVLGSTIKGSDMKATIDFWSKQPFVSKVLPFRGPASRWALRTPCWEQSVEEATSNSSQPSNSALTVHTHLAQKSAQNYFIDVSEKVSNQHFTVIFKEKAKLSVLDLFC